MYAWEEPCLLSLPTHQGAANMWMLAQVLPIILKKFVTTDSHHWECFSSLLEIMGIAFSTRISLETIVYLKSAIKNHLVLFRMHSLVHPLYPNKVSPLFGHEIALGKNKSLSGGDLEAAKASIARFFPITDGPAAIRLCNSITINGTRYWPGINNLVQIGYTAHALPELASLVKIWYVSDASVFVASKVVCKAYDS